MSKERTLGKSERVLIVGGAGYVGSVLARRMSNDGLSVRILDSCVWGNAQALIGLADHSNVEFLMGDMRNRSLVDRTLDGVDAVVVLAGLVGDPITKKYPQESASINVDGVRNVVTAAMSSKVTRLVFASTCSNYGLHRDDELASEESPLSPLSLYAEQKVEIERWLLEASQSEDACLTVLRFATAFGLSPRMRLDLTVSHFAKDAVRDGSIEVYDADTWRPYCHVEDLSRAVCMVLAADPATVRGQVFNVGSTSENYTKRMLAELIARLRPNVEVVYREGGVDARNYRVSFDKIQRDLGFRSAYSVADHMPRLLAAMETGIVPLDEQSLARMGNYILDDARPSQVAP